MSENQKLPQLQSEQVISTHEGSNQRARSWLLGDNQAVWLENLEVDEVGVRRQRRGARCFGGFFADDTLPGGMGWFNTEAFAERLLAVAGSRFVASTGSGEWTHVATSASNISGLLHQIIRGRHFGELSWAACTCEAVTETTLGIGGRSQLTVTQIDTDTETQISLAPRCIAPFQARLFYGEGETLGWSEIGDLASYSDANTLTIEPGIGGEITALVTTRDIDPKLVILKQKSIHLLTPRWGTDGALIPSANDALDTINSSVRALSIGTGCVATLSARWVPGEQGADVFFLSDDGVRSLSRAENDAQAGAGFPLSYVIPQWIDRINFAAAHKAVAAVYDNAYHLAVPMDGARDNTHVLRFDISGRAWTLHSWQSRALAVARLGDVERLFSQNIYPTADTSTTGPIMGASNPFQVYQLYSGSFDPSTDPTNVSRVVSREESKGFSVGTLDVEKRWDSLILHVSSAETSLLEVAYRRDQGQWNTVTEAVIPGSLGTIVLGEDNLPWNPSEDLVRRRTFSFDDIAPSRVIQVRVGGVTGMTEPGRMSYYLTRLRAHALQDNAEEDF